MGDFPNKAAQFKPGQSGNPAGYTKGRRNLSTLIRSLLENDIDFAKLDTRKTKKWAKLYSNKSGWEAVIYVAFIKALEGDLRAAEWLSKSAYGTRIISNDAPPYDALTPELQQSIEYQRRVIEAGEKALAEQEGK